MKVIGIDSASKNFGVTLVADGVIKKGMLWNPSSDKLSHKGRLVECEKWLRFKLGILKPDIVAVLELAVFQNKKVIRTMAHFEATAILTASKVSTSVVSITDTEARGIVFDRGNLSKDDAWKRIGELPVADNFEWPRKTTGGTDIMDAAVAALAAPSFIERG